MFDTDEDGKLSVSDITNVMLLMGIDAISIELIQLQYDELIRSKGGFTFGVFKEFVLDLASNFRSINGGKYYVMLTLEEAEHFRGVLHARQHVPLLKSEAASEDGGKNITRAALWFLGEIDMSLLASSKGYGLSTNYISTRHAFPYKNIANFIATISRRVCALNTHRWFNVSASSIARPSSTTKRSQCCCGCSAKTTRSTARSGGRK